MEPWLKHIINTLQITQLSFSPNTERVNLPWIDFYDTNFIFSFFVLCQRQRQNRSYLHNVRHKNWKGLQVFSRHRWAVPIIYIRCVVSTNPNKSQLEITQIGY